VRHLLVTNDFPPKIGGIQSYLWELWRRLDPADVTVLTTPYPGAAEWDVEQAFRVVRTSQKWLLPTRLLARQINSLAGEVGAELVVLDPVFPLGLVSSQLRLPYVAIAHGAEYAIPADIPVLRSLIRSVTQKAHGVVAGGDYVAGRVRNVHQQVPVLSIPPGVDTVKFTPHDSVARTETRAKFDVDAQAPLVIGVSRLVARKGFDRLIEASVLVERQVPGLRVLIAGQGRESTKLQQRIDRLGAPVQLIGRVADEDLPAFYSAADVFCMPCHDRWFGLEKEGFGIVFVEAAACGVPSVAGLSGGSGEAVLDGETGFTVAGSVTPEHLAVGLVKLLTNEVERTEMGLDARRRAVERFSYDQLALEVKIFLDNQVSTLGK
jgi:phosphatidyl-myo-inositol dimannoside synthase